MMGRYENEPYGDEHEHRGENAQQDGARYETRQTCADRRADKRAERSRQRDTEIRGKITAQRVNDRCQ